MAIPVNKLMTFLQVTTGQKAPRQETYDTPAPNADDVVGVNGASLNDIQNLIDYVPAPQTGMPSWAANSAVWNLALEKAGFKEVGGDEKVYEAAAYTYHAMGGELVTAEAMGEEIIEEDAAALTDDDPELSDPEIQQIEEEINQEIESAVDLDPSAFDDALDGDEDEE